MADLLVRTLTIEAGALVCVAPGATLRVLRDGTLNAQGTAAAPVQFLAASSGQSWGGILPDGSVLLSYAHIEDARQGVGGGTGSLITITNSTMRRIQGAAVSIGDNGQGSLVETVVDSACLSECGAGWSSDAAVMVLPLSTFVFRANEISRSGAGGLWIGPRTSVELLGGTIEGSADEGLHIFDSAGRPVTVTAAMPIRITGGAGYPARLPLDAAAMLLNTPEAQDGWTGNAKDTVLVTSESGGAAAAVVVRPGLAWAVFGSSTGSAARVDRLTLEPGAVLTIDGTFAGMEVHQIVSHGTASDRAHIVGVPRSGSYRLQLLGPAADTSRLSYTLLTDVSMEVRPDHPVVFQNIVSKGGRIRIAASGARLTNFLLEGVHEYGDAPLAIAASGVELRLARSQPVHATVFTWRCLRE